VYDELYRLDGVLGALDRLGEAVREQADAAGRPGAGERDLARIDDVLDALEGQAGHVRALVRCRDARDLGDAYLVLTRIGPRDGNLDAVATLARMYLGLARRHGLEAEILDDRRGGDPAEDVIVLLLSGAGARVLLAGETGLHQLTRGRDARGGRRPGEREVVRIEVLPVPYEDDASRDPVHIETRPLTDAPGRLLPRLRLEVHLRHEPTLLTLRAWTDRSRAEALEGLLPLLRARVAASEAGPSESRPPVVRRYDLGPAPLVRDTRTGRTTGRVEQVLDGDLDRFLSPPAGE
jgi:peptide chain release factor 2